MTTTAATIPHQYFGLTALFQTVALPAAGDLLRARAPERGPPRPPATGGLHHVARRFSDRQAQSGRAARPLGDRDGPRPERNPRARERRGASASSSPSRPSSFIVGRFSAEETIVPRSWKIACSSNRAFAW